MRQLIEITPLTLKRLLNFQRVADIERQKAEQLQWMEMTLPRMEDYQLARQRSDHVGALAAYAGYLFRVENGQLSYRPLYGEPLLENALIALLEELKIPIRLVSLRTEEAYLDPR